MELNTGGQGENQTGPYSEEDQILLDQDAQDQAEEVGEQEEAPQSYDEYAGEFADIAPQLDEMGYESMKSIQVKDGKKYPLKS